MVTTPGAVLLPWSRQVAVARTKTGNLVEISPEGRNEVFCLFFQKHGSGGTVTSATNQSEKGHHLAPIQWELTGVVQSQFRL